jgi:hypothetical protein
MASTIKLKNGSGAPTTGDLVQGEPALDLTNKRLYTENASGVVIEVGTNPSTIDINAGTIDGTVIGGTTPAAVTTSSLVATTADINAGTIDGTVIGGSTATAGTFTSLTADGLTTNTAGTSNFIAGVNAGNSIIAGGNYNVVVGDEAGTAITTGDYNVAVGYNAGAAINTGAGNVGIGGLSLNAATTGNNNTAVGWQTSRYMTTASNTTAIGYLAGAGLGGATVMTGDDNTLVGASAGLKITTGAGNVAVGANALDANTTGASNIAVGQAALGSNTTADNNTAVGQAALTANTTAANNTAVGYAALTANTTGTQNVAVGSQSLLAHTTGNSNVAVGQNALVSNTTASDNTAVGAYSLDANTTGANNTAVGKEALGSNTTANNNTAVGYQAGYASTGANNVFLGFASGNDMTTGNNNSILGRFSGNQGGLDIRTSSNNIVLSDGDGNPRGIFDSSGNLLVGKTATNSATAGAEVRATGALLSAVTSNFCGFFNRISTDGTIIEFAKDDTTVGSIFNSGTTMGVGSLDTGVLLANNIDAILPWNASTNAERDNAIDLGRSGGRFKDLYLSGGVYLGGTGAANHLDDYEEGSWTPSVGGTSSNGTTNAHYVKVGDLVQITFDFTISSIGTGSTSTISGVPFHALATTAGSVGYYSGLSATPIYLTFYVTSSGTIQFGWNTSGSATIQNNGGAILTSGSRVIGAASYRSS